VPDGNNVQMDRHTDIQIYRYTYIEMYRCADVQMYRCTDVQMYRCTDVQMYVQMAYFSSLVQPKAYLRVKHLKGASLVKCPALLTN
jgi:hypothetical protein